MTTIAIGDQPNAATGFADFFDGRIAAARRVELVIDDARAEPELVIWPPESDEIRWPLSALRTVPDQAEREEMIIASIQDPVARLVLKDPDLAAILSSRCKRLRRRPPVAEMWRLVGWSAAALSSVALIIFVLVPIMANQLADYLPPRGEQALGDTTFEQIRVALDETGVLPLPICDAPEGVQALERMKQRLTERLDLPILSGWTFWTSIWSTPLPCPGGASSSSKA